MLVWRIEKTKHGNRVYVADGTDCRVESRKVYKLIIDGRNAGLYETLEAAQAAAEKLTAMGAIE